MKPTSSTTTESRHKKEVFGFHLQFFSSEPSLQSSSLSQTHIIEIHSDLSSHHTSRSIALQTAMKHRIFTILKIQFLRMISRASNFIMTDL